MKTAAVEALLVRDVVHRVDHVVDRDHIDAATFDTDRRHPFRQGVAHFLDELEEIIRPVDLVDFAGLRMAYHHAGAIDTPRRFAFVTHDGFGIMFGAEVGMIEFLGFLEHVFAEGAVVQACGGDGTGVMEAAGVDRFGQFNRVARAVDIRDALRFGIR